MILCPTCLRAWIPLGEVTRECNLCRAGIGMCALVGGEVRGQEKPEPKQAEPPPLEPEPTP